eukprot:scaffold56166_cov64-Phaeocystis_antarctica.AAC.5
MDSTSSFGPGPPAASRPSVGGGKGQPKRRFQLRCVKARGELSSGAKQTPERLKPQSRERPK